MIKKSFIDTLIFNYLKTCFLCTLSIYYFQRKLNQHHLKEQL